MKKLFIMFAVVATATSLWAQGSFNAANTPDGATPGPQGVVSAVGGPGGFADSTFSIQAYWGLIGADPSTFTALGSPSAFIQNGLFFIGSLSLTSPGNPAQVQIQLRGWLTSEGANYDAATTRGASSAFLQTLAYGTDPVPDMANSGAWAIVPEPSTLTLAGLGLVGLLAVRRRK